MEHQHVWAPGHGPGFVCDSTTLCLEFAHRREPFRYGLAMTEDRSQFYTGFVADHYDLLVPADEAAASYAYFERLVEAGQGPALELACGTGRPLLDFVARGLEVDGLDASADMLALCRAKARERGLEVRLFEARMERFDVGRRYRTVFVVSSSYLLLPDEESTRRSLACVAAHLEAGGRFVAELHDPVPPPDGSDLRWVTLRRSERPGAARVRCRGKSLRFDPDAQVVESLLRYEVLRGDETVHQEEHRFLLRWHTRDRLRALLTEAGFRDVRFEREDGTPLARGDRQYVVIAERG